MSYSRYIKNTNWLKEQCIIYAGYRPVYLQCIFIAMNILNYRELPYYYF